MIPKDLKLLSDLELENLIVRTTCLIDYSNTTKSFTEEEIEELATEKDLLLKEAYWRMYGMNIARFPEKVV